MSIGRNAIKELGQSWWKSEHALAVEPFQITGDGFTWRCPNCLSDDVLAIGCDCHLIEWNEDVFSTCGEMNHCNACGLRFESIDAVELKEITNEIHD